jgi:hypothetical protein
MSTNLSAEDPSQEKEQEVITTALLANECLCTKRPFPIDSQSIPCVKWP